MSRKQKNFLWIPILGLCLYLGFAITFCDKSAQTTMPSMDTGNATNPESSKAATAAIPNQPLVVDTAVDTKPTIADTSNPDNTNKILATFQQRAQYCKTHHPAVLRWSFQVPGPNNTAFAGTAFVVGRKIQIYGPFQVPLATVYWDQNNGEDAAGHIVYFVPLPQATQDMVTKYIGNLSWNDIQSYICGYWLLPLDDNLEGSIAIPGLWVSLHSTNTMVSANNLSNILVHTKISKLGSHLGSATTTYKSMQQSQTLSRLKLYDKDDTQEKSPIFTLSKF
jgi:hypothetical protein